MFKLFANIFEQSSPEQERFPEELLEAAIERAVDGTDPRLRMLPGYNKKLKRSVVHAARNIIKVVDGLPDPVPLDEQSLASNPGLAAIFYSKQRLERIASEDPALKEFRTHNRAVGDGIITMLAVETTQKNILATALVDGKMRKDVAQTTVNFEHHTFMEPNRSEEETRRMLKRRAFDYLLAVALSRLAARKAEREDLNSRKALLRCKLDITTRSVGFKHHTLSADQAQLQKRLEDVEQQLEALGPDETVLPANLDVVTDVLEHAPEHLWVEDVSLCLDRYYVLHSRPSADVPAIPYKQIVASDGTKILALMVTLDPELLPSQRRKVH